MVGARMSIDLGEERNKFVESYRSDNAWANLSFNGKLKTVIDDLLEMSERSDTALSKVICDHWESLTVAVDIPSNRLTKLRTGYCATDAELVQLAAVLPYDTHQLAAMQSGRESKDTFESKITSVKQLQRNEP